MKKLLTLALLLCTTLLSAQTKSITEWQEIDTLIAQGHYTSAYEKGEELLRKAIGEDSGTLEEVYEPFLIKEGFLKRTPRGREVTELAYKHLGKSVYQNIRGLFD